MSCYVINEKNYGSLLTFIDTHGENKDGQGAIWVVHDGSEFYGYMTAREVVSEMHAQNVRSFNHHYRCEESPAAVVKGAPLITPAEVAGILRSWDYQSCETGDYRQTKAYACYVAVMKLVLGVIGKQAEAADPDASKTYTWAG